MSAVFRGGGPHGYLGRGAIMHTVVISTACNTATDSVDMLGNLVKGYFVHLFKFLSLGFYYYLQKNENYLRRE